MNHADEILKELPDLCDKLLEQDPHELKNLTAGKICKLLGKESGGVYLFSKKNGEPDDCDYYAYVGKTNKFHVRIGVDHRSTDSIAQATTHLLKNNNDLTDMKEARKRLYSNYYVRMLPLDDVETIALLEVYAIIKLKTEFNKTISPKTKTK